MYPKAFNDITQRLGSKEATFVSATEWSDVVDFTSRIALSNKEITKLNIDVLSYRLGIQYDYFSLDRIPQEIMNIKGEIQHLTPLVLTLYLEEKPVLVVDGGVTGNDVHDMVIVFDKLLNMNIMIGEEYVPLEFTLGAKGEAHKC